MVTHEEFAKNTFAMAFERAGWKNQIFKLCEECGELIQSSMKIIQRNSGSLYTNNMLEEMTHVELCLDMLKYDLSRIQLTNGTALDLYNKIKQERLEQWHEFEALEELKRSKK